MRRAALALCVLAFAALPLPATARPTYFEVLTAKYGFVASSSAAW